MAKKKVPSFDELKNKDYEYHYSREERLRMRHLQEEDKKPPPKGLVKLFGGNRGTMIMFFFLVAVSVIVWVFYYSHQTSTELSREKIFRFESGKTINVRLIQSESRYGINLNFDNRSISEWQINGITLSISGFDFTTNIGKTVSAKSFDVMFIDTPDFISNIAPLEIKIE